MKSGTSKIWRDAGIWEHPLPETEETYDPQNEKWKRHLKRIKRYNKIFKRLRKKV